ncbi:AlpA family transcriptional regulator [Ferruginibacter sp.]|uniref:helix-turn-helix transcriptional regulator n=1 Tax=Ferruginibacter sp. TaxID=1940288 RepID=UPI00265ABD43|nr:hypothetical protein [Ferruginibacter sp.]
MPTKKQLPVPVQRPFQTRWVDAYELRQILKISRTTLFNWEKKKIVTAVVLGGKKYYDLSAIEKFMETQPKKKSKR